MSQGSVFSNSYSNKTTTHCYNYNCDEIKPTTGNSTYTGNSSTCNNSNMVRNTNSCGKAHSSGRINGRKCALAMNCTGKMFVLFVFVVSLLFDSICVVESVPAPSSAWNQPMLTIVTKNLDKERSRGGLDKKVVVVSNNNNNNNESNGNKIASEIKRSSSSDNISGYSKSRKTASAWGWLLNQKDDNGKIQPHIRHYSKKLKAVTKLPCQAGHNRGYDGKCRQIPRFSMSRVG